MDVNTIINNTINDLSAYQQQNIEARAELRIPHSQAQDGGREASVDDINKLLQSLNHAGSSVDSRVSFIYNEKTNRIILQVTDPTTHEVVKQIPSREMIRLLEGINEMVGMFVDKKG